MPGRAADRDEPLGAPGEDVGDHAQAPVLGDDELEGLLADAALERLLEMRVLVDVADPGDGELDLVLAAVEDRHLVAALVQPLDDERPGRAGPADHQGARLPLRPSLLRRTIVCHERTLEIPTRPVGVVDWAER